MANTIYAEGKTFEEAIAKVLAKAERMGHYHVKQEDVVLEQKLVTKGIGRNKEIAQPWKVSLTLDIISSYGMSTDSPAPKDIEAPKDGEIIELSDDGQILLKYNGADAEFTIPAGVKEIADNAFEGSSVEEVDFNEVEKIGAGAFKNCSSLEKATFTNISHVGESAFAYCELLEQITFPKSVKLLNNAFDSCTALMDANFDEPSVAIGELVFSRCAKQLMINGIVHELSEDETILIKFIGASPYGSAFDIVIPESVTTIGAEAFMDKDCIRSVDFSNVRKIEHHAFESCTNLEEIKLDEVTHIGISAFEDCDSIESLEFPKPIELREASFYQCTGLKTVEFSEPPTIGDAAFERCYGLESVISEKGFIELGESAFDKCQNLMSIANLTRTKTIDNSAFRRCSKLGRIDLPSNIEAIKESVFSECKELTIHCTRIRPQFSANWNCGRPVYVNEELMIPETFEITRKCVDDTFTENEKGDFVSPDGEMIADKDRNFVTDKFKSTLIRYIGSEKSVVIPQGIFEIHKEAFINCTNVEEVFFSDVEEIGNYAFDNCENLKTVHFDKVIRVGKSAFEDCAKLVKIEFLEQSEGIIIESSAFFSCKSLSEVVFKGDVERIDYAAFGRCGALKTVVFEKNCKEIGANAYEKCEGLISIGELKGLTSIGDSAFRKCRRLRKIELPDTLYSNDTGMGNAVFAGCDGITIHYHKDDGWAPNWACGQRTRKID